MGKWKWVWRDGEQRERLHDVGILPDGSLWNPNNYPEDIVHAAIAVARARRHERRSRAAQKAAVTRQARQERKVLQAARRLLAGLEIGESTHCEICGRGLDDPQSIKRGVGSECWQELLSMVEHLKVHATA